MKKTVKKKMGAFFAAMLLVLSIFSVTVFAADTVTLNYGTSQNKINVVTSALPKTEEAELTEVTFTSDKTISALSCATAYTLNGQTLSGTTEVNSDTVTLSFDQKDVSPLTFTLDGISNCTCNITVSYKGIDGDIIKSIHASVSPVFTGSLPNELPNNSSQSGKIENPNQIINGSPNVKVTENADVSSASSNSNRTTASQTTEQNTSTTSSAAETISELQNDESETSDVQEETTLVQREEATDTAPEKEKTKASINIWVYVLIAVAFVAIAAIVIGVVVYNEDKKKVKNKKVMADQRWTDTEQITQNPDDMEPTQKIPSIKPDISESKEENHDTE